MFKANRKKHESERMKPKHASLVACLSWTTKLRDDVVSVEFGKFLLSPQRVELDLHCDDDRRSHLVVVTLFFLCKPYVTRIQQTRDKNPQNCDDFFFSWIVPDNKSGRW